MSEKAVHIALYPSDWLAGTRGLTPAETGVYITLVCMMYERQAPLPFDHSRLARMCNCPAGTFKKILAVLIDERKLVETPEGLWQRRVEREISAAKEAIGEASDRAKRAAEARWSKARPKEGECENAKVKRQSDEQQSAAHTNEKPNEISNGDLQAQCPSNANQNQNQRDKDDDDDSARETDRGLMEKVCDAAGRKFASLNGNGTKFGMSPSEVDALRRWRVDLSLSDDVIISCVQNQAARMRSPPNSLTYFTPGMQDLAGRLSAPALTPIEGARHDQQPSRRSHGSAADDAFAKRIDAAARARSPSKGDFGFG